MMMNNETTTTTPNYEKTKKFVLYCPPEVIFANGEDEVSNDLDQEITGMYKIIKPSTAHNNNNNNTDNNTLHRDSNARHCWYHQYYISPTRNITCKNSPRRIQQKNEFFHELFDKEYSTKLIFSLTLTERNQIKEFLSSSSYALTKPVPSPSIASGLSDSVLSSVTSLGALTYGELVDVYPLYTIFLLLKKNNLLPQPGSGIFYDLGSGSGRVVLAACLLFPFKEYIGIEILSSLLEIANKVKEQFFSLRELIKEPEDGDDRSRSQGLSERVENDLESWKHVKRLNNSQIRFHHGSIVFPSSLGESNSNLAGIDWTSGSLIFINSTCFDEELMEKISFLCARLRPGSIVITLTHMLSSAVSQCECIHELRLDMSWGMADYFVFVKRQSLINDEKEDCATK